MIKSQFDRKNRKVYVQMVTAMAIEKVVMFRESLEMWCDDNY